jgi:hypothetical protein
VKTSPQIILMASGSEVQLIVEAGKRLASREGISVRLVSFPSWELFAEQDAGIPRLGAAARVIFEQFGFTGANVEKIALEMLRK